ncbi:hypothetical protein [Ferruginibacter albus]|uniref:hypothetical protein n=1 Tax=Ferruginibacter albus TaxID=2875540 RepID=UPI001CC5BCD0|nr:hypothetical protein [Ferruginibacter albus]UAY50628.1 hypothetical protein K9M53_08470 [Ferruginibacter albus]
MKIIFLQSIFFLLIASCVLAQENAVIDISNLTENSPAGCLSGNCKDGEGVYFYNYGYFLMYISAGTFSDGYIDGYAAEYTLRPYGADGKVRLFSVKRGMMKNTLLKEGSYTLLSLRSGDTLETAVGTFEDTEFKGIKLIKGTHFFYPMGKSSNQFLQEEGSFDGYNSFNVKVTSHNLLTMPDNNFTINLYNPLDYYCLSGDCINGKSVLLTERGIYAGKFKDHNFASGTIEFFNAAINDGAGIFTTKDGVNGTFTPAGSNDAIVATLNSSNDYKVVIKYDDYRPTGSKRNKISQYAQNWLTSVYIPDVVFYQRVSNTYDSLQQKEDALIKIEEEKEQAEYEKNHPYIHQTITPYSKETDPYYYSPEQKRQMALYNQSGSSGGSSSSSSYSSFSSCSVCGGRGYMEYDCGGGGGHLCRKYCTACNGTGRVHN